MADLGLEPQSVHVTAFHAAKLAPSLKIGEKEDLDVRDRRVAVLGLEEFSERQSEFDFDATHGSDATPSEVTQAAVQPLTQATVAGINSLLLVLGAGTSGKSELVHGQDESKGEWNGLMEAAIESLFNALPSDALSEAENLYRVRMQFLSVYHERVIDLLQPNCHAHDLPLKARAGAGIEVIGADEVEVEMRGMQKAVRIYRGARDQLSRLVRYHGVDQSTQCNMMTLTLYRSGGPRQGAAGALYAAGGPGGADGADGMDSAGELKSKLTIVELPGSEKLSQEPSTLAITEEPFAHRSITQFRDLVKSLASRGTSQEHVAWTGGKLAQLLSESLGNNALTRCVATLRAGQARDSAATLECASMLRKVRCYPVVNSTAARGLQAIGLSEVLALRNDLRTLATKGHIKNIPGDASGLTSPGLMSPRGSADAVAMSQAAQQATAAQQQAQQPGTQLSVQSNALLEESKEMGRRIEDEIEKQRLDEQRKEAIREKAKVEKLYYELLKEKQKAEAALLDAESEKLEAKKSLIDLQVTGAANENTGIQERIEHDSQIKRLNLEKKELGEEKDHLLKRLEAVNKEKEDLDQDNNDLLVELVAARAGLEKVRQQEQTLQNDARERDLEIVRSVKQAEAQQKKNEAQGDALNLARRETEEVREKLYAAEAKCTTLEGEVAGLRRESATARAQREELQLAARRAAVQRELFEVSVNKEKAKLDLDRQQFEDDFLAEKRQAMAMEQKELRQERQAAARRATELIEARAEVQALREKYDAAQARNAELETEVDESERRLQMANEGFRQTLQDTMGSQFNTMGADGEAEEVNDEDDNGERSRVQTAEVLLTALRDAFEKHEDHLRARFERLKFRHLQQLDKARRDAAAAETRGDRFRSQQLQRDASGRTSPYPSPGADAPSEHKSGAGTPSDHPTQQGGAKSRGSSRGGMGVGVGGGKGEQHAALQAIQAAGEEAAMSALQAEGRAVLQAYVEEAAQLRSERGVLRGELQAAVVKNQLAAAAAAEERKRLLKELAEVKLRAERAERTIRETGGENASVKLPRESNKSMVMQGELLAQLETIGGYREKLLELKEQEKEETGASFAEVRAMRLELGALRNELNERALPRDPRKVARLRLAIRDYHQRLSQMSSDALDLEKMVAKWKWVAANAEKQKEDMEASLNEYHSRYQKEILKLQMRLRQVQGVGGNSRPGTGENRPLTGSKLSTSLPPLNKGGAVGGTPDVLVVDQPAKTPPKEEAQPEPEPPPPEKAEEAEAPAEGATTDPLPPEE